MFLWSILFAAVCQLPVISAFGATENHAWEISNIGYDAPNYPDVTYDGSEKLSSTYDVAPSRVQTDSGRRIEAQRTSFALFGRLLAAKTTTQSFNSFSSFKRALGPAGGLPRVIGRTKNGVTTRYVYGAGLQYEVSAGGQATYYHYDQSGNTAMLTSQGGAVVERIAYAPYGTVRYRQTGFDTPFLFGGFFGVMSDANGLIQMRARYYNPLTARFMTSDPAMEGWNWYAYAGGNPVNFADPSGFGGAAVVDALQGGLTVLGFAPVVGAVADIVNAGISAARGDAAGAAFNLASAVPGIGDAAAAGKIAVVGIGAAKFASTEFAAAKETATVTSWASKGITPDLNPGRWVQLGEATPTNFFKTGLPGPKAYFQSEAPFLRLESSNVPFSNSITGAIPKSSLQWPQGWEVWKGIFGQRQIKP